MKLYDSNLKYSNTGNRNEKELSTLNIQKNVSLKNYNTWHVGGEAECFSEPKNIEEVRNLLQWTKLSSKTFTVLGGGSNVLISDEGIQGLVISLNKLKGYQIEDTKDHLNITALSGTPKSDLLKIFLKNRLPPALFLVGLPGNIGGGVVMNAGMGERQTPSHFSDIVSWVEVLSFKKNSLSPHLKKIKASDIKWSYRNSQGWQPGVIVRVGFSYPRKKDPLLLQKVKQQSKKRTQTQPLQYLSCGSVFKNPKNHKSAILIEQSGLKGFRLGGAKISTKHANFILNDERKASAQDIYDLIQYVKKTVKKKQNVLLETEVIYLGQGWTSKQRKNKRVR